MLRNLALLGSVTILTLIAGCARSVEDADADESMVREGDAFAVYPTEIRPGMRKLGSLDPFNTSVGDFGTSVRNQGSIASCASFGFLGMLENQMFNERGISPDLSERFMVFSNFFQTGTLGGDPKIIAHFPELVENLGLLTEDLYPYSGVEKNAHRFDQDAAQGLTTNHADVSLASAIEGTANESRERSDILQKNEFIGALPQGPYPITLPVKATLQPNFKMPEVEFGDQIYSCFAADGPSSVSASKRLKVSPREFLSMCFDLIPKNYFTCAYDADAAAQAAEASATSTDACGKAREVADAIAGPWLESKKTSIELALALLDEGDAVMMGVTAPASPNNLRGVWSTSNLQLGGGHAVLAIGYLTNEELESAVEQSRGVLASGLFDKLAASVDPDYQATLAAGLPADPQARRDVRVASRLGQRMKQEGGIIVFRNSWGAKLEDFAIGVDGNQAMTFDYFVKAGILVQGRSQPRITTVAWPAGNGPAACPATVQLPSKSAWLASGDRLDAVRAHLRKLSLPAECPQE